MFRVAAQHNVGTTPRHVGGHGNHAFTSGIEHHLRLVGVLLRVEHVVRHPGLIQQDGKFFRLGNVGGTYQNRLAFFMPFFNIIDNRLELSAPGRINQIRLVNADHRLVRRNRDYPNLVGIHELGRLGFGGTGHAR